MPAGDYRFEPIPYCEMYGRLGICASCGLLAISPVGYEGLGEALPEYREIEKMGEMGTPHSTLPACFAREYRLAEEVHRAAFIRRGPPVQDPWGTLDQPTGEDIKFVLDYGRECKEWTPYSLGFTPKEHREMLHRERTVERQDLLRKEQQRFQLELLDRAEKRADKRHWVEMAIVGGIVTLVVVASTIIAALIESGHWFPRERPLQPIETAIESDNLGEPVAGTPSVHLSPPLEARRQR